MDIKLKGIIFIAIMAVVLILSSAKIEVVMAQGGNEDIIFTEIMYDVEGSDGDREWVEIYNTCGSDINIDSSWRFFDGSNHTITVSQGDDVLNSCEAAVIVDDVAAFMIDHPGYSGTILDSVVSLNNSGEELKLSLDNGASWLVQVVYNSDLGAAGDGNTLEYDNGWIVSSVLGGSPGQYQNDNEVQYCDCQTGEPIGDQNTDPGVPPSEDEEIIIPPIDDEEDIVPVVYSTEILINELVPDPEGSDEEGEFIELYNMSIENIDLSDWQLKDSTEDSYTLTQTILAGAYLVLWRGETNLTLNNSGGDAVRLYQPDNSLLEEVTYDSSIAGQSYSRTNSNDWEWTEELTPGLTNLFPVNEPPQPKIDLTQTEFYTGQLITFSATDSLVSDDQINSYYWDFGNGDSLAGVTVAYYYQTAGEYTVSLLVEDSLGLTGTVNLVVNIITAPFVEARGGTDLAGQGEKLELISEIREHDVKTKVLTQGIVTALPGNFSDTYFYISQADYDFRIDLSRGIQVYCSKKDFPNMKLGDIIMVQGEISETGGEKRVKIASAADVQVITHIALPMPEQVMTGDVSEDYEGGLITVIGDLVEKKGSSWYLDDDSGELRIYLSTKAEIKKPTIEVGGEIIITGIIGETKTGYRLLPRFTSDLSVEQVLENEEAEINVISANNKKITKIASGKETPVDDYLGYGLGVVGVSALSWVIRAKFF